MWKKFTKKLVEGEPKTIVTSSGVKIKPEKEVEMRREETILNWFTETENDDSELGEVFRSEIWQQPMVMDAYGNGDEEDMESNATGSVRGDRENSSVQNAEDLENALAIAAAWADSDSE